MAVPLIALTGSMACSSGPRGFPGDVVGAFRGPHLAAAVDSDADDPDQRDDAHGNEYGDASPVVPPCSAQAHPTEDHQSPRCRYWSTTEVAVEVRVLAPGRPGSRRSARLTVQVTVTVTVPTCPTGTLRPPVSMLTDVDAHVMPWSLRDSAAAD